MNGIDPRLIWKIDKKYAEEGIPFHARPLRAAMEILGDKFSMRSGDDSACDTRAIEYAYHELIPETKSTWPGSGTGIAASVDQVRKIVVPVVFGTATISAHEALGFLNENEWWAWCRTDKKIAAETLYAFADTYDFIHGLQSIASSASAQAVELWQQASSNIEVIADSLSNCYRTNSIIQPVCMAAELAMKGTLIHFGATQSALKKNFGHRHSDLAEELIRVSPAHPEDNLLLAAAKNIPDYIQSRYEETSHSRLEIVKLALSSQFIAAASLRRASGADETIEMSKSQWPGPRLI